MEARIYHENTRYYLQRQATGQPGTVGTAQPIPEKMLARLALETSGGGGHTAEGTMKAMQAQSRMVDGTWQYKHPRTHAIYAIAVCRHQDSTKG